MWTETARDKQRRDPTVGSTGGGESSEGNQVKIQRGSPGKEETTQSGQPRGGEPDSPGGKPSEDPARINRTTASSKADSREKKLSKVKTGTRQVPEEQSTVTGSAWRIYNRSKDITHG